MRIALPYGAKETVTLEVPDQNVYFIADRGKAPALKDPIGTLRKFLKNPIGGPTLQEAVGHEDKVVIVGDDITRPTPQNIILPVLLDELNSAGVPDDNIQVIIALATHREMSEKEIKEKYGDEVVERVPVINHDLRKCINMGRTETGIPISVNKDVCNADFVIGVGNIVP
ncbi:MAG: lactate racemase domain-containing protein, partial [Candidatus Jordarchaeaceae archaeon]